MNTTYTLLGALGFPVFHLVDLAAIKRIAWAKPAAWISGCALIVAGNRKGITEVGTGTGFVLIQEQAYQTKSSVC